ncbi:MAG: lysine--tRNA ligase [Halobacteria archaeon]
MFWADEVAYEVKKRCALKQPVIKAGASPSGGKHIGNLNDILRGYFIVRALELDGIKARFIHTCDDRDPLRKIPERLPDRDGEWKQLTPGEIARLERYIGMPYVLVPDPFGCCENWARHFNSVWLDGVRALGVEIENFNNDDLYREGKFQEVIIEIFSKIEVAREIMARYQTNLPHSYIPYMPICNNCGRITATPLSFNLETLTVKYSCETKTLAGEFEISGCGYKGETAFSEGKLPWRFEWPGQWKIFQVDMEPFGKDHFEGSWPSGQEIARRILKIAPPIPFVYEFFLVNGAKMSTRHGNVYIAQDLLKLVEPEVLLYFYSLTPMKQKNLDLKNLNFLVDSFDRFERLYFEGGEGEEVELAKRVYPMCIREIKRHIRIPYTFAAMLGVSQNIVHILKVLKKTEHLPADASREMELEALTRVFKARNWAAEFAPEEYRFELQRELCLTQPLDERVKKALFELADYLLQAKSEVEVQNAIFEIARRNGIKEAEFFKTIYQLLLGKPRGPRLGPFLRALDEALVQRRLRLEG